jgi:SAM-dependent methyltransferase
MRETSKCKQQRVDRGDFERYLRGEGMDIGVGSDPLRVPRGTVRPWDRRDGQFLEGVYNESFDFVYSSHCLEHMRDVEIALNNWTRVLRPGGFLYIVVPDYMAYEKATWPSRFNRDHKHSFSLDIHRLTVNRTNHWKLPDDIEPILTRNQMSLAECFLTLSNIDWNRFIVDQTKAKAVCHITLIAKKDG